VTGPVYSDAELADLDLGPLFAAGLRDADGRVNADLQGVGSVAAAVQLENHMVRPDQVARAVAVMRGEAPPTPAPPPPALGHLVDRAVAACDDDADRDAFLRWLGTVADLMAVRAR